MSKVFDAYARYRGVTVSALEFNIDGKRIREEDTFEMLELKENDKQHICYKIIHNILDCPNNHGLIFSTIREDYQSTCDICNAISLWSNGYKMYQCRECDFDICKSCFDNYQIKWKEEEAAATQKMKELNDIYYVYDDDDDEAEYEYKKKLIKN